MPGFQKFIDTLLLVFAFIFFTTVTQIGGVILIITSKLIGSQKNRFTGDTLFYFGVVYCIFTFLVIPIVAPIFGRVAIENRKHLQPTSYFTILCNRNYVVPEVNYALQQAAVEFEAQHSEITIYYLDANFPFFDGFPLLPHLSHNDGKKVDLSFVYEDEDGIISNKHKSNSGYGVFENPLPNEQNQTELCKQAGYWQYDYSKYLTLGKNDENLLFSEAGTRQLITVLLSQKQWGKLFIEPHLKQRLNLTDARVRFHGCGAVRHDDHIHLQLQ